MRVAYSQEHDGFCSSILWQVQSWGMDTGEKDHVMKPELESLLDRVQDYLDRPLKWAEAWARVAEMYAVPCFRGQDMVSWITWLREVSAVGADRKGLTADIVKESACESVVGESAPDRDFGVGVRLECWLNWSPYSTSREYYAWSVELVSIHQDYDLEYTVFESFDQWLAELEMSKPTRKISL